MVKYPFFNMTLMILLWIISIAHTPAFTIVLTTAENNLIGSIPTEICALQRVNLVTLDYDNFEVEGCSTSSETTSGTSKEFSSTYSFLLFTCGAPLLVWAFF